MPELPEVETVCRGLAPVMVGATLRRIEQRRADLRFPFPENFADRLMGREVTALTRRAKYALVTLAPGNRQPEEHLVMHLGMSGRFRIETAGSKGTNVGQFEHVTGNDPKHDHVVFYMSNGATITYNDTRRFGYMTLVPDADYADHKLFRDLGVEPLGNEMNAAYLASRAVGRTTDLKAFLMDQRNIAGLGNIYVCEALHRSALSPKRKASALALKSGRPSDRAERLASSIRHVLRDAIKAGGSTLRDHRQADGSLGYFQHSFSVYGREGEPCRRSGCPGRVVRYTKANRSTFYCPKCQR